MASAHDRAVLQAIFNPTSPSGDVPGLNQEEELTDDDSGFEVGLLQQVKDLEMEGVTAAEAGDLPTALERFSQAIDTLPQRASGYNNRAQTRRLQEDTEGKSTPKRGNRNHTAYCPIPSGQEEYLQWGKKVFSQPPIVQVLSLKKMREACNFHHRYTSTMTDKMRKKNPENHIVGFFMNLFANYGGK
uniref:Tetratricopeptide repeat protein 36 n=1 Tax=Hucho hucho TaxID=62062 RepID=A0A4W5JC09_9TELE